MTIAELKQYRSICAEIKDLEDELKGSYVGDSVTSASGFPYSKHKVHIEGYKPSGGTVAMLARLSELKAQKGEVEKFVAGIKDYQTKEIFRLRFICGYSWIQVSHKVGGNTADSCRMKVKRFLNNF